MLSCTVNMIIAFNAMVSVFISFVYRFYNYICNILNNRLFVVKLIEFMHSVAIF